MSMGGWGRGWFRGKKWTYPFHSCRRCIKGGRCHPEIFHYINSLKEFMQSLADTGSKPLLQFRFLFLWPPSILHECFFFGSLFKYFCPQDSAFILGLAEHHLCPRLPACLYSWLWDCVIRTLFPYIPLHQLSACFLPLLYLSSLTPLQVSPKSTPSLSCLWIPASGSSSREPHLRHMQSESVTKW